MQTGLSPAPEPAPPPGRRRLRRALALVLLAALVLAAFTVPIPLIYAYTPGPVRDAEDLVSVSRAETYSSEGSLYMTTVSVDVDVTAVEWIEALFDPTRTIVSREQVTGGRSFEELEREQLAEMRRSKQQAREVVLEALGYGSPTGEGARVVRVLEGSPADGVLRRGDVVVAINGRPVSTACDASTAVSSLQPGARVELRVRRGAAVRSVAVRAGSNPAERSEAFVGVLLETVGYRFDPGIEVRFDTGRIAGPSAGLILALALYDQLTEEDMTGGRAIAGTGTLGCGGEVGPIGGVEQKVAGAEAAGASVFLSPRENYEAARAAARDIEVVAVGTFDEALDYLGGLR